MKRWFDTFEERKEFERTTKREILNYGIKYIEGVKKYYLELGEEVEVIKTEETEKVFEFSTDELRSIRNAMGEKAAAELRKNHNKPTEKYLYYVNIEKKAQNEIIRRNNIAERPPQAG